MAVSDPGVLKSNIKAPVTIYYRKCGYMTELFNFVIVKSCTCAVHRAQCETIGVLRQVRCTVGVCYSKVWYRGYGVVICNAKTTTTLHFPWNIKVRDLLGES